MAANSHTNDTNSRMRLLEWQAFPVYLLLFLLCYLPVLLVPFAFADDYFFLSFSLHDRDFPLQYWPMFVTAGRPFFTLFWWFYSLFVHKIADLALLRLLGIVSLALLAFCLYKTMMAAGWRKSIALLIPIIICTMPAFQVYISWATISCAVILTVIAGASVYLGEQAYAKSYGLSKYLLWLSSVITLLVALAVTQCNPMFFWVFVAIILFRPDNIPVDYLRRFFWYLTIFLSSCALDFAIAEISKAAYGVQSMASERAHLTHHVWKKIIWFINEPLNYTLNFQQLMPSSCLAICLGILILLGLSLYLRGKPIKILIALGFIPLCYLPNLVIAENGASYRTTAALSAILVLYALFAIYGFRTVVLNKRYHFIFVTVLAIFTMISYGIAYRHVFIYFAIQQGVEIKILESTLSSNMQQKRIFSLWNQIPFSQRPRYDEFWCSSMSLPGLQKHILYVVQHEK